MLDLVFLEGGQFRTQFFFWILAHLEEFRGGKKDQTPCILGKYSGVLGKYSGILGKYSGSLDKYSGILGKYSGILGEYSCILGKYIGILGKYSAVVLLAQNITTLWRIRHFC